MVPVSAKSGAGINDLLEMILLVAEVQELKAIYLSYLRKIGAVLFDDE